jgi:hypothetical protein
VGNVVVDATRDAGDRLEEAGREARPAVHRVADGAKTLGVALWDGIKSVGRSLHRLVTGSGEDTGAGEQL